MLRFFTAVLMVFAVAIAVLAIGGYMVAGNVRVETGGRDARIETPFGSVHVKHAEPLDPHRFGIPVYPGATRLIDSPGQASVEFDSGEAHRDFAVAVAAYATPDSPDRVASFYSDRLGVTSVKRCRRGEIVLEVRDGSWRRLINLKRKHGETHILLASIGEGASN